MNMYKLAERSICYMLMFAKHSSDSNVLLPWIPDESADVNYYPSPLKHLCRNIEFSDWIDGKILTIDEMVFDDNDNDNDNDGWIGDDN